MKYQRFKSIVHPERYGFWADPDGAFTLLGSIALTIAVVVATQMGDVVAGMGELWRSAMWDGPLVRIGLLLLIAFTATLVITDPEPRDFSKTARFHLWIATVGATFVLGSMMIWSWPGFDFDRTAPLFDYTMRICAIAYYVIVVGRAFRKQMIARQVWVKAEIERLGTAERTARITPR